MLGRNVCVCVPVPHANVVFISAGCGTVVAQASCIDSTASAEVVFAREVSKLKADNLKPQEQLTLEPFERDHAVVVGVFRPTKKSKE